MSTPEHPPRGRHAAESPENSALPSDVLHRAERQTATRRERAHQMIGDALLAYLQLSDTNPDSEHLADNFHAAYRGDHATLDEAIKAQLDGLGWSDALRTLLHEQAIPDHALVWDYDAIHAQMVEIYDFVEHDGRIYQFLK